jgi:hypothetical protein
VALSLGGSKLYSQKNKGKLAYAIFIGHALSCRKKNKARFVPSGARGYGNGLWFWIMGLSSFFYIS